jgi:hypothetical protein
LIEKITLEQLLKQKLSGDKIAFKLGCSRSNVEYWERKYGLLPAFGLRGSGRRAKSPEQMAADMTRLAVAHRRGLKARAIEYKGGRCALCGYDRCNAALEFHHVDRRTKAFGLSRKGIIRSWGSIKKEIDKCLLVCSNCHREVEAGARSIPDSLVIRPRFKA